MLVKSNSQETWRTRRSRGIVDSLPRVPATRRSVLLPVTAQVPQVLAPRTVLPTGSWTGSPSWITVPFEHSRPAKLVQCRSPSRAFPTVPNDGFELAPTRDSSQGRRDLRVIPHDGTWHRLGQLGKGSIHFLLGGLQLD